MDHRVGRGAAGRSGELDRRQTRMTRADNEEDIKDMGIVPDDHHRPMTGVEEVTMVTTGATAETRVKTRQTSEPEDRALATG